MSLLRIFGLFALLLPALAVAQDSTAHFRQRISTVLSRTPQDSASAKKQGLFLMPLLYYTPDTRWAYGATGIYYFRLPSRDGMRQTRLSYAKLLADYTQNEQLDIWSSWNIFLREEKYILKGEFRYRNFPDRFYGIGNNTLSRQAERYEYDLLSIKMLAMRKITRHFFGGFDYQGLSFYNLQTAPDGELATGKIPGAAGGFNSGFGAVLLHDSRDNVINASRGLYAEASTYVYRRAFGSDFEYTNLNLQLCYYRSLRPRHVIATQWLANLNWGVPPFTNLAAAGNDDMLRGYARNRFRDLNFVGAQVEYRFPLVSRLGGVVFGGAGDVFATPEEARWQTLKYTYGAGLRLLINRRENLNLRFDYGFGRDGNSSFYLLITEAF